MKENLSSFKRTPALAARSLLIPKGYLVPIRLANMGPEAVTIYSGTIVGMLEEVQETAVSTLSTKEEYPPAKEDFQSLPVYKSLKTMTEKATQLTSYQQQDLFRLLCQYAGLFATHKADFGRTDAIQHNIHVEGPPIC